MIAKLVSRGLPLIPPPLLRKAAGRYVAGDTRAEAIALAAKLRRRGFATTLDILGEDVQNPEKARRALADYIDLMAAMERAGIDRNISIKLSMLGLRGDQALAWGLFKELLSAAAARDFFVRIDMEDSSVTDVTLEFYMQGKAIWPKLGTVLQSRLKRTARDAAQLAASGANFRLCKGIYLEPEDRAYQKKSQINDAFMEALSILLSRGSYVGIATHDPHLLKRVGALLEAFPEYRDRYEYQALLGVPLGPARRDPRRSGSTVRIYIPFGLDWYAYGLRRLRENPHLALQIAKGLLNPLRS